MMQLHSMAMCVLLMACTSKKTTENDYAESALIHNSMIKKANDLEHTIHKMMQDSLPSHQTDSLQAIIKDLATWKEQLVEVPGNETHEHKGHDHHAHTPADVTPGQMVLIQKDLDSALNKITKRLFNLTTRYTNEAVQSR